MQNCIPSTQRSLLKDIYFIPRISLSSYHNSHYPFVKRFVNGFSRSVWLLHVCHTDSSIAFRGFVLRVFANWRDRFKNKNLKQKSSLNLSEHPRRFQKLRIEVVRLVMRYPRHLPLREAKVNQSRNNTERLKSKLNCF